MRRFPSTTWRSYALLGAALLALTFGVTAGLTASGPGETTAVILGNSFMPDCPGGYGAGHKEVGRVTAIREKGWATFRGKLRGAQSGKYVMKLYNSNCHFLSKFGSFDVDGSGDGDFAKRIFICPGQTYFLDFHNEDTGTHNSTPFFKLGSSGPGAPGCPAPRIRVVKFTNGKDANDPPGPLIRIGTTVTWTYVVTNPGNVPLHNVVVTDDQQGTVTSFTGDTNGNGELDPTETWTYTLSITNTRIGLYTNLGTATGEFGGETVTSSDPSHYTGRR
jgi:hypothetical protein